MYLLIDNYDSFTYNLWHYLGELGAEVEVVRNDAVSAEAALAGNRITSYNVCYTKLLRNEFTAARSSGATSAFVIGARRFG